jgi:SAM-dependent methyltransferase
MPFTGSETMEAQALDAIKEGSRREWDQAAQGWHDHTPRIRAWLRVATDAMLDLAGVGQGARVLDVAAGAGDQTLDIARRVGPDGQVLATDLSPGILAFAAANAAREGLPNVATQVADAERLPIADASFDAAVCRLGLMLFPDPAAALREMRRVLRPGARASVLVFGSPEHNPCVATIVGTALEHAGVPARDPFAPGSLLSLGKPGCIDALFREAGFVEVATTRVSAPFRLPDAASYLDFVRASASPIRRILSTLDATAQAAAWKDMEQRLGRFTTPHGWEGPNELLLTGGRR